MNDDPSRFTRDIERLLGSPDIENLETARPEQATLHHLLLAIYSKTVIASGTKGPIKSVNLRVPGEAVSTIAVSHCAKGSMAFKYDCIGHVSIHEDYEDGKGYTAVNYFVSSIPDGFHIEKSTYTFEPDTTGQSETNLNADTHKHSLPVIDAPDEPLPELCDADIDNPDFVSEQETRKLLSLLDRLVPTMK